MTTNGDATSETAVERESMEFDVVIVGAGPAGLAAAIRLKQAAAEAEEELNVVVLEKGSEVGAHILSGAVIDPVGLDALIPEWREQGAPLTTEVTRDKFLVLGPAGELSLPNFMMPWLMSNHGNYIGSLGDVVRWLGEQAEALGVEVYPGLCSLRDPLQRKRRRLWRRNRRHGRWPRWRTQGQLHARHGAARQVCAVCRRRARLALEAVDPPLRPRQGLRSPEVRHRHERALGDRPGKAPARTRPALLRLAARRQDRRWFVPLPLRRKPRCRRLRRASELQEPVPVPVRGIPALQDPSRDRARRSKAASASLMAPARSPKAAGSRCRS